MEYIGRTGLPMSIIEIIKTISIVANFVLNLFGTVLKIIEKINSKKDHSDS